MNKLHAHVYKGSLLSATLKRRLDGLAKTAKKSKPGKPSQTKPGLGPAPNRASRLIVRNLPFDITEQDLRAIFLPYGPIYSVHLPLAVSPKSEDAPNEEDTEESKVKRLPRSKGFAFVWFLSRKDAEKAMETCNGMTVEAGMAETMFSDKQKKKKQRREEKKLKAQAGEQAENDDEEEQEDAQVRRTIAVDWALSKDKWEAEKAKLEAESGAKSDSDEDGDEATSDGSASGGDDAESSDDEQLGLHKGDSEDSDDGDSDLEDDEEAEEDAKPVKPTLPAPEVGTTVFVRNVPFEATDDELRTLYVLSTLIQSFALILAQFPCIWSSSLCSRYDGPCNWSLERDGLCMLLEQGRCG